MDIDKIIVDRIYTLLDEHGLTQRELANKAKINYQNLNRLMKGHRSIVKSDVLPDIARVFGVTAESLKSVNIKSAPPSSSDRASRILALQSTLMSMTDDQFDTAETFINGQVDLAEEPSAQKSKI